MVANRNIETRDGGVKRDVCEDEKQLFKVAWPNNKSN